MNNNIIYIDGFTTYNKSKSSNNVKINFRIDNREDWLFCKSYKDFKQQLKDIYGLNNRLNYYYLTGFKDGLYQYDKISTAEIQSYFK